MLNVFSGLLALMFVGLALWEAAERRWFDVAVSAVCFGLVIFPVIIHGM
jgi:hypothetical protein